MSDRQCGAPPSSLQPGSSVDRLPPSPPERTLPPVRGTCPVTVWWNWELTVESRTRVIQKATSTSWDTQQGIWKCRVLPIVCSLLDQGLGDGPGVEPWTGSLGCANGLCPLTHILPICKMSWVRATFYKSSLGLHLRVLSGE